MLTMPSLSYVGCSGGAITNDRTTLHKPPLVLFSVSLSTDQRGWTQWPEAQTEQWKITAPQMGSA
jgi:hypothetical protein